MNELPHKLKLELATVVYTKMYSSVQFFVDMKKYSSFIAWVGTVIRQTNFQELEYIFKEGEKILEMFFLVDGEAAYVLPPFCNHNYL